MSPSVTANIRLGWLLITVAYYAKEIITTVKSFIVQALEQTTLITVGITTFLAEQKIGGKSNQSFY